MHISFTKMQGAGNDFVVLDETRGLLGLSPAQYRFLADRHFGVGADQILSVRPPPTPEVDFGYAIHNADGGEVAQCGNGARCFAAFVRARGLTTKDIIRVQTSAGVVTPQIHADGRVTVDMGAPVFDANLVPFDAAGLVSATGDHQGKWPLALGTHANDAIVYVAIVSMGNPHAVQVVADVDAAPVASMGPLVESHPRFVERVNAGFMQVVDRNRIKLRVYERGAGETLACGTGACAAVVAGIQLGLLDSTVEVETRGGSLTIEWQGGNAMQGGNSLAHNPRLDAPVYMTGPATFVFSGEIDIPDIP